ncbi:MAG TPA: ribonuclease J [bacterium]|nr:ribonuclease J [bacterium]
MNTEEQTNNTAPQPGGRSSRRRRSRGRGRSGGGDTPQREGDFAPRERDNVPRGGRSAPRGGHLQNPKHLSPGDSYIFVSNDRHNKKMFPYLTPKQALRRKIGTTEYRPSVLKKGILRVIPFGGVEQVGLNCMGFEYNGEILIVDMGIQFADQNQHGINGSIPDLSYVKNKKVVGVAITHGHIDHIGAIPYIMPQLGRDVPMYATPMAYELIKFKQGEVGFPLNRLQAYERNKPVQIGKYFIVTPFTVDHSIPDSVGLSIETPVGRFVHTGDWKFDRKPLPYRPSTDYDLLKTFGDRGVRALFSDSTNAHLMGSSISESEVVDSIEEIIRAAKGRIITATFSSIIDRVMIIIAAAEKCGRKVVLLGRGMNNYMDIAIKLGYARPKEGTLISMEQAHKLPDDKIVICCTGAQGERFAALMRITTGESRDTSLKADDTIVFSSSVIPGNERAVQSLFDLIAMQGPRVYQYKESEIHAGGHARREDTLKMISLIRPEIYVPIYGYPHMLYGNARNAYELGYTPDKVPILSNGQIIEFSEEGFELTEQFVPHRLVTVDGNLVGMTKENHLHDRYQMCLNGVIVVSVAKAKGEYLIRTDARGMVDLEDLPKTLAKIEENIRLTLRHDMNKFDGDVNLFKKFVAKKTLDTIFLATGKEPMVLVTVH